MLHHRPLAGRGFARTRAAHDLTFPHASPLSPSSVSLAVAGVFAICAASLTLASGSVYAQQASQPSDPQPAANASQGTAVLPATTVSAGRDDDIKVERVSSGALGTRRAVDTPFSVVAVNSEQIKNQMAQTATDAFKYDPAVTTLSENKRNENSYFAVRGMRVDMLDGTKVDGQNFVSWQADIPLEPFEQVELLKGLSGFMYGFGAPGGIVNYVLKRPTDEPLRQFSVGYEASNVWSEKLDLGGRFGPDNRFGYRLNIVNEEGNTAEPNNHVRRKTISLATDWRITPDLTWTADVAYWKRQTTGTLFGMNFAGAGAVPDANKVARNVAQPFTYYETDSLTAGTSLDYRIDDQWKANFKYRFARQNRLNGDSFLSVLNAAGDYADTQYKWKTAYYYQAWDAMMQGKFTTGPLKHDVVFGVAYQSQVKLNDNGDGGNGISLGTSNIYNPSLLPNQDFGLNYQPYRSEKISQRAIYASDTIGITSRISLLAGLRYTQFNDDLYDITGQTGASYRAKPVSPTVALMYKTDNDSTAYVSYVESLEPGGSASITNVNFPQTFGPLTSKQYEVGWKADKQTWGANLALFRVERGYGYTNQANYYVQDGTQRFQGLDASGWVRLARDWRVMGGVLLLNTKAVDVDDPSVAGKRIFAAPRYVVTGRVEYDTPFVRGLTLAAGVKVTGEQEVDAANTLSIPAYTTIDLSARYATRIAGKSVVLRAAINNLTDKHYWTTTFNGFVLPGSTRTFLASATMDF
ncbi:TonB-dependent siderophore receptor [Pandoraea communis]|uniref:TonB-dependent siderophore receptor n=1 Tax=Pandoraea communis TaxID=2508297 RepID=UPI0025A4E098|nr:TonB-dependent siderophore receptor [Pandoraea communis]MDM8355606.1 TonB-dependent siderophore receptor [Pandoraea communis]